MSLHACFKRVNDALAKSNTRLVFLNDTEGDTHVVIASDRIRNLRDGKKATPVLGAFCPFCGERLVPEKRWPNDFNPVEAKARGT